VHTSVSASTVPGREPALMPIELRYIRAHRAVRENTDADTEQAPWSVAAIGW